MVRRDSCIYCKSWRFSVWRAEKLSLRRGFFKREQVQYCTDRCNHLPLSVTIIRTQFFERRFPFQKGQAQCVFIAIVIKASIWIVVDAGPPIKSKFLTFQRICSRGLADFNLRNFEPNYTRNAVSHPNRDPVRHDSKPVAQVLGKQTLMSPLLKTK